MPSAEWECEFIPEEKIEAGRYYKNLLGYCKAPSRDILMTEPKPHPDYTYIVTEDAMNCGLKVCWIKTEELRG